MRRDVAAHDVGRDDRARCARWCSTPGRRSCRGAARPRRPDPARSSSRVRACGVCRTDLHIVDGELTRAEAAARPRPPDRRRVVRRPGRSVRAGRRVGVPWLGWTCGDCRFCRARAREPLRRARASPATTSTAATPSSRSPTSASASRSRRATPTSQAAPLLCAGLIGYRALRMAGDAERARALRLRRRRPHRRARSRVTQGRRVFAFTRPGDDEAQAFARELGAVWAGGSDEAPPEELDAAIIFAPVGELVPAALARRRQGRHRRLRRDPHERHPVVPVRAPLGRAGRPLGGQPHARGRRGVPRARAAACRCAPRSRRSRSRTPRSRSPACAEASCAARLCSCADPAVRREAGSRASSRAPHRCRPWSGPSSTCACA